MTDKSVDSEFEDLEPWWKGPMKYILAIFLVLLLILWFIPVYSIKLDPSPKYIPELVDAIPLNAINNKKMLEPRC